MCLGILLVNAQRICPCYAKACPLPKINMYKIYKMFNEQLDFCKLYIKIGT